MVFSKNNKLFSARIVRLTLMISSLALLLMFQIFWLASSYEQSYMGFQRETSALLRSTVFSIRDSLFQSDLDHILPPHPGLPEQVNTTNDPNKVAVIISKDFRADVRHNVVWEDSANVMGVVGDYPDSGLLHRNFVIRMRADDTLSTDLLRDRYKTLIAKANYTTPFIIRHDVRPTRRIAYSTDSVSSLSENGGRKVAIKRRDISGSFPEAGSRRLKRIAFTFNDTLITETIPIGPIHAYAAIFPRMRSNIINRIAPQLFFSGFLTAITAAAFFIMYRNLRSQERVVEMKNDFISNVTHELKTPIATVSVALEALKDFNALKDPARTSEYLAIAQHELTRLSLMTDKILKASVFEQHGAIFITGRVRLDDIVNQVAESLTVVLDRKKISATVRLSGSHFDLEGSDVHLTNVVYNLLDNAIKYSPQNTSIKIDLKETEDGITLAIHDQGIGIDAVYHKRIFEKFFRVPTGDVHNTQGYGLGLNYVAAVVRSHGGKLAVDSGLDQGSTFTIHLPKKHG
ncbi:MAG: HAMP domain-containing sensor histidine kinase [Chryseolinea sp.]